jgi:hypothetical protein
MPLEVGRERDRHGVALFQLFQLRTQLLHLLLEGLVVFAGEGQGKATGHAVFRLDLDLPIVVLHNLAGDGPC